MEIKCDKCKLRATQAERDLIEIETRSTWMDFIPGEVRYGCDNHKPKTSRIYRIGDNDYPHDIVKEYFKNK